MSKFKRKNDLRELIPRLSVSQALSNQWTHKAKEVNKLKLKRNKLK